MAKKGKSGPRRVAPGKRRRRSSKSLGWCALCGSPLKPDDIVGVKGAMAEGQDVTEYQGGPVRIDLCGLSVIAVAANPGAPVIEEGFQVIFILCSDDCAKALSLAAASESYVNHRDDPMPTGAAVFGLRIWTADAGITARKAEAADWFASALNAALPHVAARLGLDDLPPWQGPESAPGERRKAAEAILERRCAWCLTRIADDAHVECLYVLLKDRPGHDRTPGTIVLEIGGRYVPCRIPNPGSSASFLGDAGFMLCSNACADALSAAIVEEQRLSIVH